MLKVAFNRVIVVGLSWRLYYDRKCVGSIATMESWFCYLCHGVCIQWKVEHCSL